jgi:hypothetical protein
MQAVQVYDFNPHPRKLPVDANEPLYTRYTISHPTRIVDYHVFTLPVETCLPYTITFRCILDEYVGIMIDEERMMAFKHHQSDEREDKLYIFT